MAKNEIATVADEAGVPAYLQNVKPMQADNFDSSDVVIPNVKLLQGLSEEVSTFPDAKAGIFWHTGADMALGESIRFIIVSRRKKYILQAPLEDGQGILARSDDAVVWDRMGSWQVKVDKKTTVTWAINDLDVARSGLTQWGTSDPDDENSPPAATLVYEYLVMLPDYPELGPALIRLARSAIRKAKKGLNDKILLQKNNGRPMQALVFAAKSVTETSDSGPYNNWSFTSSGFASEPQFRDATRLSETLTSYRVADEVVEAEGSSATTSKDAAF